MGCCWRTEKRQRSRWKRGLEVLGGKNHELLPSLPGIYVSPPPPVGHIGEKSVEFICILL